MPNVHLSIWNLNAPVECPIIILAFESSCSGRIPSVHLSIQNLNAQVKCPMPICAFEIWMLRWNSLCPSEHSKSECSGGMPPVHLSIRNLNLNAQLDCSLPICALDITGFLLCLMLRWMPNAQPHTISVANIYWGYAREATHLINKLSRLYKGNNPKNNYRVAAFIWACFYVSRKRHSYSLILLIW